MTHWWDAIERAWEQREPASPARPSSSLVFGWKKHVVLRRSESYAGDAMPYVTARWPSEPIQPPLLPATTECPTCKAPALCVGYDAPLDRSGGTLGHARYRCECGQQITRPLTCKTASAL